MVMGTNNTFTLVPTLFSDGCLLALFCNLDRVWIKVQIDLVEDEKGDRLLNPYINCCLIVLLITSKNTNTLSLFLSLYPQFQLIFFPLHSSIILYFFPL
jgi:hypothetical protein